MVKTVLFICTGNSIRSQMAEGLLRHYKGDSYDVFSAGTYSSSVHPNAVEIMAEIGIDITSQTSDPIEDFIGKPIDIAITVCDNARDRCPSLPNAEKQLHWGFPDPSGLRTIGGDRLSGFRKVRDDIRSRILAEL